MKSVLVGKEFGTIDLMDSAGNCGYVSGFPKRVHDVSLDYELTREQPF